MNQESQDDDTGTGFYQSDQERGDQALSNNAAEPGSTTNPNPVSKKKFAEDDQYLESNNDSMSGRHHRASATTNTRGDLTETTTQAAAADLDVQQNDETARGLTDGEGMAQERIIGGAMRRDGSLMVDHRDDEESKHSFAFSHNRMDLTENNVRLNRSQNRGGIRSQASHDDFELDLETGQYTGNHSTFRKQRGKGAGARQVVT